MSGDDQAPVSADGYATSEAPNAVAGFGNVVCGVQAARPPNCCILLGTVPEPAVDYTLSIRVGDVALTTVMTPAEYEVVNAVVRRTMGIAPRDRVIGSWPPPNAQPMGKG